MDVKLVPVDQNAIEHGVGEEVIDDALERYALAELRQEHPDVFPPLDAVQQSMLMAKQLDILHNRIVPASRTRMGHILAEIAQKELWRFHPAGYESLEEYLASINVSDTMASQLKAWSESVFPLLERMGYDPMRVVTTNMTNLRIITPHLDMLATGEPSKSEQVCEEVEALIKRYDGSKEAAATYLVEQAMLHPSRSLRQNIALGEEEDVILVYYRENREMSEGRIHRWSIRIEDLSTAQRNMVFRRLGDIAEFVLEDD